MCEIYLPAGPAVRRPKSGYTSQRLRGAVTGLGATAYHKKGHTDFLFYGDRAEERATEFKAATTGFRQERCVIRIFHKPLI